MKKHFVILLCCILSIGCFAQDEDSLAMLKDQIYYHYHRSDFAEVVRCGKEALVVYESVGDLFEMAGCYSVLGIAYQRLGRFKEAIESYELCAETMERLKASEEVAHRKDEAMQYDKNIRYTRNNMAEIHFALGEYDEAERLYRKCIEMLGTPDDTSEYLDLAVYLQNLAGVDLKRAALLEGDEKQARIASAVEMAEQALALSEQYVVDKPFKRVNKRVVLAQAYFADGRTDEAIALANKALEMAEEQDNPFLQAEIHAVNGEFEAQLGHFVAAERHYRTSVEIADENGFDELLMSALSGGYESAKHFDSGLALGYFERSTAIRDSIFNAEQQQLLRDYQARYDLSEKEHQIALQSAKNRSNKLVIILLSVLAFLLLILFALGMYVSRTRRRKNEILEKNSKVKDHVFSIVSHDFKTSVLSQNLLLTVMDEHLDEMQPDSIKEKVSTLKTSSDMLKGNMLNMLEWMKMEMGGGIGNRSRFDLRALVEESIGSQWIEASKKHLNIVNGVGEDFVAHDDVDLAKLIIRNLINNAVKFSWPEGVIHICAEEEGGRLWLVVADQGMGMNPSRLEALTKEPVSPQPGAQSDAGSGIGLVLCKDLLELNGEKIVIESEEGKGTTVRFSLKKG